MKTLLLALCLISTSALTQDLRVVNGQLYNIKLSTNWTSLPRTGWLLRVVRTNKDGTLVQEHISRFVETVPGDRSIWNTGRKAQGYWQETTGMEYLIKNLPGDNVTGARVPIPVKVMRVGTAQIGEKTLAVYDYGVSKK